MESQKDKYLTILSHELKAPIANISLLVETLYEYDGTLSTYKKKEMFELGLRETDRLKSLSNYFLDLRKAYPLDKRMSLFPNVIFDLDTNYEMLLLYKNCFVTLHTHGCQVSSYVRIPRNLYSHVILNLLGNAIKFSVKKECIVMETDVMTSVDLSSFSYSDYGRSSVIDKGLGFTHSISNFINVDSSVFFESGRFGLLIVKDILSACDTPLSGISYPLRGAKLFFDIKLVHGF